MKLVAVFCVNYNGWFFKDPSYTLDEELLDRACDDLELPSITCDFCDEDGYCSHLPGEVQNRIIRKVQDYFAKHGVTEVVIEEDAFST